MAAFRHALGVQLRRSTTIRRLLPLVSITGPHIRPVAIAAVRRGGDVLAAEFHDPARGVRFCRPLGGGIEFGELAEDAVRRELSEEIGAGLERVSLLGVLENRFRLSGRDRHEIVFVFDADLSDKFLYDSDEVGICADDGSKVSWHPLTRFSGGDVALYPAGLGELLSRDQPERPRSG